ncbi:hypothetical protein GRS96_20375 (plasmid) [Rathayibacter sp. VKM Ac-2803]|uniref:hypothetical protein n=1 Tax=Rathayibacter sp. VKM Ac-2803 TaxID=2609256 RepID=UPI00135919A5|nr:hypothetical protein [Rathayibacter sp. VKM Ac-2803]MWV51624.1 hypothetical protein [Rathayibacter sp. VKM Ac-2803]
MEQGPSLFGDEQHVEPDTASDQVMTQATRGQIRQAFAKLGVTTAREQFKVATELTGLQITSVADLTQRQAQTLLISLTRRVESAGARRTGNAWADRDEDTWIDKL